MKNQITVKGEFKKRMDLINDSNFRKECAKYAQQIGITEQEWNQNKAGILMMIANEVCGIQDKSN
jgi:hypothetical protein